MLKTLLAYAAISVLLLGCNSDSSNDTSPNLSSLRVVAHSPESNILLIDETLEIEFSEAVDPSSLETSMSEGSVNVDWSEDSKTVSLTPATKWPSGNFSLTFNGSDLNGLSMGEETLEFTVNLSFENYQAASVVLAYYEIETDTGFARVGFESFGNAFAQDNELWLTLPGSGQLVKYNVIPTVHNTKFDESINSMEYLDDNQMVQHYNFTEPQSPYLFNDQMLLVDYIGDSILIFNNVPEPNENNFGIIIGRSDFESDDERPRCGTSLKEPEMITVSPDGKLILADYRNHRVLIWHSIPTEMNQPADLVLGQPDLNTCTERTRDDINASALTPSGVWSDGEKLLVLDAANRVMVWNTFPTENNTPADLVLGQPDFYTVVQEDGPTARTVSDAYQGITSNGRQIFVVDSENRRVLVWNDWPTENYMPADIVLGQPDFVTVVSSDDQNEEDDSLSLRKISGPTGLVIHNDQLIVTDTTGYRILIFNSN